MFRLQACNCVSDCNEVCSCGWQCVYDTNGRLLDELVNGAEDGTAGIVMECGPLCPCSSNCGSRVAQKGMKIQLRVLILCLIFFWFSLCFLFFYSLYLEKMNYTKRLKLQNKHLRKPRNF